MFVCNPVQCRKAFHNFFVNLNNPTLFWIFWVLVSFLEYEFWNYLGIKTFGSETKKQKISPVTLWRWWKSRNRTIFNIIRWVAGSLGWTTHRPSVFPVLPVVHLLMYLQLLYSLIQKKTVTHLLLYTVVNVSPFFFETDVSCEIQATKWQCHTTPT